MKAEESRAIFAAGQRLLDSAPVGELTTAEITFANSLDIATDSH
jgi:hypothetical protein